jgi:hypothetical protein
MQRRRGRRRAIVIHIIDHFFISTAVRITLNDKVLLLFPWMIFRIWRVRIFTDIIIAIRVSVHEFFREQSEKIPNINLVILFNLFVGDVIVKPLKHRHQK